MAESEEPRKSPIEVVGDEDWKEKVKAEDAKLDAERSPAPEAAEKPPEDFDPRSIPPASFATMVQMFSTQALVSMGLIPLPDGQVQQQLPLAKHFIDLLAVLEEKSKRNLTGHEANLLESTLHELRMAYVEVKKMGTAPASHGENPTEPS